MITKEQSALLKKLIKQYVKASVANSWAGTLEPIEREEVRLSEVKARHKLNGFIRHINGSSKRIGS